MARTAGHGYRFGEMRGPAPAEVGARARRRSLRRALRDGGASASEISVEEARSGAPKAMREPAALAGVTISPFMAPAPFDLAYSLRVSRRSIMHEFSMCFFSHGLLHRPAA